MQSRQKSYADVHRRHLKFAVGDRIFLKVSPRKGIFRFGKKEKLAPQFVGPFKILERVGNLAYRLALPPRLSAIHPVFHVSMLQKYEPDPSHRLDWQDLVLAPGASFEVEPISILGFEERTLRNRRILMVKV